MDLRLAASSFWPMDAHTSVYTTSANFTDCKRQIPQKLLLQQSSTWASLPDNS